MEKGNGTESPVKCHNQWNTSCQAEGVSDLLLGMIWLTAAIMKAFFTPPNHFGGGRDFTMGSGDGESRKHGGGTGRKRKELVKWMRIDNRDEPQQWRRSILEGNHYGSWISTDCRVGMMKKHFDESIRMNEVIHASRSYDEMQFNFMMDPSEIIKLQLTRWIKWL